MDPFTQRMLERARARQEKIDQKLANSGQSVPKRKPLAENLLKTNSSPVKSPSKPVRESITSPKRSIKETVNCNTPVIKRVIEKSDRKALSPQKVKNDVIVTKKEFKSPNRGSLTRRNSDVSVEINISHRNDIQIEVQVEERDAPISIVYDSSLERGSNVQITEIEGASPKKLTTKPDMADNKTDKTNVRTNFKSRLDRLGNLYSDSPNLSSPIHRTELEFSAATPPAENIRNEPKQDCKKKFGRLAALADQINNWEDDLSHHTFQPEPKKVTQVKKKEREDKLDASTLDVSIHSINDINSVLKTTKAMPKKITEPKNKCQRLDDQIVAELAGISWFYEHRYCLSRSSVMTRK
ncbi:unnamed protein product [Pieris macdunnoughi]|uniref:Anillin N-terminal domain-containing protein n=1 Tax=Pieris macdunnoughi TaxID=345717 RepID=A0A821SHF0_9NEOP|nr:unnamed protein product [Pieris macdunnoughi]